MELARDGIGVILVEPGGVKTGIWAETEREIARRWRYALAGDVGDWIERIGALAEAGADKIWFSTERGDLDRQIHYMKLFAEEIRPRFA